MRTSLKYTLAVLVLLFDLSYSQNDSVLVNFRFSCDSARQVSVAGGFNDWNLWFFGWKGSISCVLHT
jgi:hypothetical protein